ncbi:MAG: tyrosine-type recombinase/integrase [Hyphomicrobiaceae bacterium]|nr:tyrosine-type recombinase/integrase [Hyphomicrobiaceae bacterium]
MDIRLKHIKTVKKHLKDGTTRTYYYHRRTNKRIKGEPETPEFLASYAEAAKFEERNRGQLAWLITQYKKSSAYISLAPSTKEGDTRWIAEIEEKFGTMPIKALEDRRVRGLFMKWRDEIGEKSPRQADYMWSVIRKIITQAVDRGYLNINHFNRPGKLYTTNRANNIWSRLDVEKFMLAARPEMQLAMMMALHTGQRQGDLLKLTWTAFDGGWLEINQSKGGSRVLIPLSENLLAAINKERRQAVTIMTSRKDLPWKADNFKQRWRATARRAGIENLTFHDLRGTFITLLTQAGATPQQIATISGHSLPGSQKILDTYTSRTRETASAAMELFATTWAAKVTTGLTTVTTIKTEKQPKSLK